MIREKRKPLVTLCLLLLLLAALKAQPLREELLLSDGGSEGRAVPQLAGATIEILGYVWSKTRIVVLIRKATSPSLTAAAADAFRTWNRAIDAFARGYGYDYLSKLEFVVTIEGVNATRKADVLVTFSGRSEKELGTALLLHEAGRMVKATIVIYVSVAGRLLSPTDVFNVALHEAGHALGLGHASAPRCINGPELMYKQYSWPGRRLTPTTLDLYALAVAYSWLKRGYFESPPRRTVTLPRGIEYRLMLYYRVSVKSEVDVVEGEGWYPAGSKVTVRVKETVIVANNTRYIFAGWSGDISSKSAEITVTVDRDVTLVALWRRQYWVEIITPYGEANVTSGWCDEGASLMVAVHPRVLDHGNGTRRVHVGWELNGSILRSATAELTVGGPATLKALWETQYQVEAASDYGRVSGTGWYPKGSRAEICVSPTVVQLSRTSRAVFRGWEGPIESSEPCISFEVWGPMKFVAEWVIEYWVNVSGGLSRSTVGSGWYAERTVLTLAVEKGTVTLGRGERAVLTGWTVNGEFLEGAAVSIEVKGPTDARAEWRREYLVSLEFVDALGRTLPWRPELSITGPRNITVTEAEAWLEPGEWTLKAAHWRDLRLEVRPRRVLVEGPADVTVKVAVTRAVVYVSDLSGLPALGVTALFDSSVPRRVLAPVCETYVPLGERYVLAFFAGVPVHAGKIEASSLLIVRVPLGLPTLILLAAVLAVSWASERLLGPSPSRDAQASS